MSTAPAQCRVTVTSRHGLNLPADTPVVQSGDTAAPAVSSMVMFLRRHCRNVPVSAAALELLSVLRHVLNLPVDTTVVWSGDTAAPGVSTGSVSVAMSSGRVIFLRRHCRNEPVSAAALELLSVLRHVLKLPAEAPVVWSWDACSAAAVTGRLLPPTARRRPVQWDSMVLYIILQAVGWVGGAGPAGFRQGSQSLKDAGVCGSLA